MKTIYIDIENHRVFKSIDELKQDAWFLTDFLTEYNFYLNIDRNNRLKKISEVLTNENIEKVLDNMGRTNWATLTTNKNIVYLNYDMGVFTDDLKFFVEHLNKKEVIDKIIRDYSNFLDLFNEIKNTNENGYEFILHNYIEYAGDYDVVNLEE